MSREDHHEPRILIDASPHPPKLWIAILFAAAAVAVRSWPAVGKTPDGYLYLLLAANLAHNFCYSASAVATHLCIPTWGYQPPGYPVFIAITQWATFPNDRMVVVCQTIVFAAAVIYLARWLFASHRSPFLFHLSVVIAMLSPITIGWSRAIMTELLTSATTIWVLTELMRSMLQKKIRIWPLGLSLAAAMLMRWDQICILVPTALALLLVLGWRTSLRPLIAVIAISAIPYLTLMARAAFVGLPLLPSPFFDATSGFGTFYRVAALDERATEQFVFPILTKKYYDVQSDGFDEYTSRVDRSVLHSLFARLRQLPAGSAMPRPLDQDFASIATNLSRQWFSTQIVVPFVRAGRLWQRWIGHNIAFSSLGEHGIAQLTLVVYSIAVIGGVLAGAIFGTSPLRALYIFAVVLAIVRTAFLVSIQISALEYRYLDELSPAVDMLAVCAFWFLIRQYTFCQYKLSS